MPMTAMAMRNAMVRAMRMARSMVAVFLRISRLRLAFSDSCSSDRTEVSGSSSSGRVRFSSDILSLLSFSNGAGPYKRILPVYFLLVKPSLYIIQYYVIIFLQKTI